MGQPIKGTENKYERMWASMSCTLEFRIINEGTEKMSNFEFRQGELFSINLADEIGPAVSQKKTWLKWEKF